MNVQSNPLAIVFGRVLRQLRARRSKSSREVARLLQVSDSAYRLIEAGGAILNPVHTPMLIGVFQSLVWHRLLAFLTCAQASEYARRSGGDFWETARVVGGLEPALNALICGGLRQLRATENIPAGGSALDRTPPHCIEAVQRYLEGDTRSQAIVRAGSTPAKSWTEWAALAPDAISPIQLDMLLREIETLQHFPPNVPPKEIALWEEQNSGSFKNVYAFTADLRAAEQVARKFHWDYLFLKDFGTVNILTTKSEGFPRARNSFLRSVASAKGGGSNNLRRVKARVKIMEVEDSDYDELARLLRYDTWEGRLADAGNPHCVRLKNVWLYKLKRNDLMVGFVDSWEGKRDFLSAALSKGEVDLLKPHLILPWKKQLRTS